MKKIICVSYDCKRGYVKCFPELRDKAEVIYNPVDMDNIIKKAEELITDLNKFENKKPIS